ncbi:uric acid degradation bifunctional protein TTL-like [Arachis ipaensis]|uniref:uric acid degradation bifunctional protein TTL-like n=1 Tax=Arachis ipaensis TaxID=130454 RepID=UPI000A2AFE9D|nr:uric acid degradation bifunctional protein TTL-like [Arachis ipaensis]
METLDVYYSLVTIDPPRKWKLEERDLFLCGSSVLFCKAVEEASPFSSLEHATSFARDLWFNTLPVQSWLDAFSAHMDIGDAITIAHREIRTVRCLMSARKRGLLQFGTKYRKKFGFGFVTSTNLFLLQQIQEEVKYLVADSRLADLGIRSFQRYDLTRLSYYLLLFIAYC